MFDTSQPSSNSDRGPLLAVLAAQLGFVPRPALQEALRQWRHNRSRSLVELLVELGVLAPRRRPVLEDLVRECLIEHKSDPNAALAALLQTFPTGEALLQVLESDKPRPARNDLATLPGDRTSPGTSVGSSSLPAPVPHTPETRYRILRVHARGALGVVSLARDEELHREVALKEIQYPFHQSADSRARFLMEAEITGQLEHPGIVPIYSLGAHPDGRLFYAMRFIKGQSLHEAIYHFHKVGRNDEAKTLALRNLLMRFVAVCNAIGYAHSRGVVHRDIKPSNIMLGPYGETLVVDWGLAKLVLL